MTSGLPGGPKNEGRVKKSAFGTRKENDEEVEREEEEEKGDEALVGKEERVTSNAECGFSPAGEKRTKRRQTEVCNPR
ncbi:hypothetical protein NDU88_011545 [Pleurodeles waltl]|uniref:Uncharacterized protein n=1 Tax=Pleurodeles waltl TaxID=8319 RepID=A0AAV7QZE8_PLEWA|nr:hypothetical protein NDU88_011545 [Pleurodeles waltl]